MSALTGPSRPIGEVQAEVVIGAGRRTEQSAQEALDELEDAVDRNLRDTAEVWGDTLADGMSDQLSRRAPEIADDFDTAMSRQRITGFTFRVDQSGNVVQRWVRTELVEPVRKVIEREAADVGGMFSPLRRAVADAVGAGFNISGRSPLIVLLVPLLGYIIALVTAAIQALNGLAALLLVVPMALYGLGIQAGILIVAFEGMGSAIQAAFAAENAEELEEALKDLTPSAQAFVKELLPLETIFKSIQKIAQENLFAGFMQLGNTTFGTAIDQFANFLSDPAIQSGIAKVAFALGQAGDIIIRAFTSAEMKTLLTLLMNATPSWVVGFALAISDLLKGIADISITLMPFFQWLGAGLNAAITEFGVWLTKLSKDPEFLRWLDDAKLTLQNISFLFGQVKDFVVQLMKVLSEAGGADFIRTLGEQFKFLKEWLENPLAVKALEGLIHALEILSWMFIGFIAALIAVFALLEIIGEFIVNGVGPAIMWFFETVGKGLYVFFEIIGKAIYNFFYEVGAKIMEGWDWLKRHTLESFDAIHSAIVGTFGGVMAFIGGVPQMIMNALSGLGTMLYNAGANMIQSLINGLLSKLGPLGGAMSFIAGKVAQYIPHSPAELGPLSGEGDPMKAGQTIVERLATGMEMEAPRLGDASNTTMSNINFGSGAFQMNFYGPPPNQQQATGIGTGLGNGISGVLAQRDARLTVRAMA